VKLFGIISSLIFVLVGCSVMYVEGQPRLQSISGGNPTCLISCANTNTATHGEGGGAVTGATVSTTQEQPTIKEEPK
jgi:hypothetical protein